MTRPAPTKPEAPKPEGLDRLWTITDVARYLACSRRVVERLRSAGRLPKPSTVLGRRSPRWSPEAIRRWAEGGAR
jgi:predicted DNA-binding transcriptional regulator AlpA